MENLEAGGGDVHQDRDSIGANSAAVQRAANDTDETTALFEQEAGNGQPERIIRPFLRDVQEVDLSSPMMQEDGAVQGNADVDTEQDNNSFFDDASVQPLAASSSNDLPDQGVENPSLEAPMQADATTTQQPSDRRSKFHGDSKGPVPMENIPEPPTDEALVGRFLTLHNNWVAYKSTLEQLEDPIIVKNRHLLAGKINSASEPLKNKDWNGPNLSMCEGGEVIVSPIDVVKTLQHTPGKEMPPPTTPPSLEILSDVLLQPGMKYRGSIFIPGLGMNSSASENDESDSDADAEMNDTNNDNRVDGEDTGYNAVGSSNEGINSGSQKRTSSDGRIYELIVMGSGTDKLGHKFIMATHRAYGDEQAVHIQMNIRDFNLGMQKDEGSELDDSNVRKKLEIEYADGETVCKGCWVPNKFRFEGCVHQRLQVNDGIFHTSDAVTHVFTLYPCTNCFPNGRQGMDELTCLEELKIAGVETNSLPSPFEQDILSRKTRALATQRHRTHNALVTTVQHFNKLYQHMNVTGGDIHKLRHYCEDDDIQITTANEHKFLNKKQQLLLRLRHDIFWANLLTETCILGERLCAEFRRRASILDNTSFETCKDRLQFIGTWKEAKMDMASTHAEWDEWGLIIKNVSLGAFMFDCYGVSNSMATAAIQHRIMVNFNFLESAYQRASSRLPIKDLEMYQIPRSRLQGLDGTCIICQSPLHNVDGIEAKACKLPCSHCFHEQCVRRWLHDHLSCPVCRFHLVKDAKQGSNCRSTS